MSFETLQSSVLEAFFFAFLQIGIFNLAWKISESEETIPNNRRESGVVREEQQTAKEVAESTLCLFKDYFDSRIGSLKCELKEEAASKSDKTSVLVARPWVTGDESARSLTSQRVPDKDINDKYYFDFVDNDKRDLKKQLNILQLDSYEYKQSKVYIEKSIWKPCQELVWLNLIWNSLNHSIQVPSQRSVDLITCINQVMDTLPFVSARILAGVTGRVISMLPVIAFANANIALKKPTKLSSTYDPKVKQGRSDYICCNSTYAVDGDKSVLLANGDFVCAHSDSLANQQSWWAVDLQNIYVIYDVDIFGRTDCCTDQSNLANFDVEIMLPTCTYNHWNDLEEGCKINCHYQETESQRITVTCPPNTKGRYIRIKRRDTLYLVICEVEVYGNPINNLHESGLASTVTTYACGKIGYGYVGPVIGTSIAQSNIQCTSTCITKTACSAAEYDKSTKVCTLKGQCLNATQSSLYEDNDKQVFLIQ
ncbi:unnamed protein product [Mytilus coruscus]|uniref:Fucolectin tachylectin-4 pentraxin-1 domain-containing protein n=1 Tax=Mytilus coruscus TaxID=42192 RepID=A0A6J8B399_MYTCO|nr:unnamed protein product [Mytilus coruscus]